MAVMEGGEPTVITNAEGSRCLPSVVAFSNTGERLATGKVAKGKPSQTLKGRSVQLSGTWALTEK